MMMVLVRQTEDCDMLLHMVMTDMKLLVVQIKTADITAGDVDKVSCSTDVKRSKQNLTLPALQDDLILSVIEQLKTQVVTCTKINQDNKHVNDLITAELKRYKSQERALNELKYDEKASTSYEYSHEIESLKHTLSEYLKEKESFKQKITILKDDFQKEKSRNIDRELALDKQDMYDSWKSRMELYMLNRQHGRMILESVEQGPLLWPSVEVEGVTRLKKYSELSAAEAIQANCDVKATNIILQGLPPK
nr:hypothetical protein [Tanacetum cinerariifolium]